MFALSICLTIYNIVKNSNKSSVLLILCFYFISFIISLVKFHSTVFELQRISMELSSHFKLDDNIEVTPKSTGNKRKTIHKRKHCCKIIVKYGDQGTHGIGKIALWIFIESIKI